MTDAPHPLLNSAVHEARQALQCLHIAVECAVAEDVYRKVIAAFIAYDSALAQARRDVWDALENELDNPRWYGRHHNAIESFVNQSRQQAQEKP